MTKTFNSQKINTDPVPYVIAVGIGTGMRVDAGATMGWTNQYDYAPRPEFDNNPNPILVGLRRAIERGISVDTIRFAFASCDANPPQHISRDHIEHARRVLMRLGF